MDAINVLDRLETTLRVRGGHVLSGSVETHGAKNAALPIMADALLAASFDLVGPLLAASVARKFRCPEVAYSERARPTCTSRRFARSVPRFPTRTGI